MFGQRSRPLRGKFHQRFNDQASNKGKADTHDHPATHHPFDRHRCRFRSIGPRCAPGSGVYEFDFEGAQARESEPEWTSGGLAVIHRASLAHRGMAWKSRAAPAQGRVAGVLQWNHEAQGSGPDAPDSRRRNPSWSGNRWPVIAGLFESSSVIGGCPGCPCLRRQCWVAEQPR